MKEKTKPLLDLETIKREAKKYFNSTSRHPIEELYGINDGKAIGTYIEQDFRKHIRKFYEFQVGSSASGIDFPSLGLDLKVTSISQPQSSCPYRDAAQKVYGLGYHLLVFVYEKTDDNSLKAARMTFLYGIFIESSVTADFLTTKGLNDILSRGANENDIVAFLEERNLPLDEIGRTALAKRILSEKPKIGCLRKC